MAENIELKSYQQILGSMIAKLKAATDITDLSPGSVTLTILEAAAAADFAQEGKLIQLLSIRNIDRAVGVDLEGLAFELGVTPQRLGSSPASVFVNISETAFTKVSSNIYAGATSPAAGDTTLKVVDATAFDPSGILYVGRSGQTFEAVNYISAAKTGSFWTFTLSSPLTKDHLVGEEVVLAQGGDRNIVAGSVVVVPSFGGNPAIQFTIENDQVLLDGEDTATGILATANDPGSASNVGRNKISQFQTLPWSTAAVANPESATGGRDLETDAELRQRIKDHVHDIGRGTERAIIRNVIGVSDSEENKRVVSAFLRKPTSSDQPATLFIDDGTGYAPPFSGVGEEVIVTSAVGTESFFQLQKWPLVKAQVASIGTEPFNLSGGEALYVEVDGQSLEAALQAKYFRNLGVVTAQEVAEAINDSFSSIVEARAKDGHLFITPIADDPDYIRVGTATTGLDANIALRLPTRKQFTLRLYLNDKLLQKGGQEAILQSFRISSIPSLSSSETLQFNVDGIDSPLVTVTDTDFGLYTSNVTVSGANATDWATIINKKFIGVTATAQDDGTFTVKSNRGKSTHASLSVIGGTLVQRMFALNATSAGKTADYKLNRLLGQLELANKLSPADQLKAGTVNTRGFITTNAQASFNLSATSGLSSQMVVVSDALFTAVKVLQSGSVSFTIPSSGTLRVTGATSQFANVLADDYAHFYGTPRDGILRVKAVGPAFAYVDFYDPSPQGGTVTLDGSAHSATFFRTPGLPQLLTFPSDPALPASQVVDAFNNGLDGILAVLLDSGAIRVRTSRFDGLYGLSIPSISGNAANLGVLVGNYQSNDAHIAAEESSDLTGTASGRLTVSVNDNVAPYDDFQVNGTPFTKDSANQGIETYLGSNARVVREPAIRLSTSELTLRDELPGPNVGLGPDMRASALSGLEFGQEDNMVFMIDNDPSTKVFDIPMYIDAVVAGPSVPTTSQMDLVDSTGASLGSSSRWTGYNLQDYKIWFQAKRNLPFTAPNSQLKLSAVPYGPNGEKVQVGIVYPSTPDSDASSSISVDPANDLITARIFLASGPERLISLAPGSRVAISTSGSSPSTVRQTFLYPVDLSGVQVGDISSINDNGFNAANIGPMRVQTISNLNDFGKAYQFLVETATVDVIGNTDVTFATAPSELMEVGDKITIGSVTRLITAITSQTDVTVTSPGFTSGSAQTATVTHQILTASSAPSFTIAPGDLIQVASTVMTVTSVVTPTQFNVDIPFAFTGQQTGTASRIYLEGLKRTAGVNQVVNAAASQSIRVFQIPAAKNTATLLALAVNNTAGVKDVISASNATGSSGSGSVLYSTSDESGSTGAFLPLQNGESFIYLTSTSSPVVQLKEPVATAPSVGDLVRLVPTTARNVLNHFSKKQISGLSVAADVALVDHGRRVQVSSKVPGGLGQVYAIGGRASGVNILAVRDNAQEVSATRAVLEMDKSSVELLSPGHTIRIYQTGRAKKSFTSSSPSSSTSLEIQVYGQGVGQLLLGVPLVTLYPYTQTGNVTWAVRNIGRNRVRYEIVSGTASLSSSLRADDWVLVGNGITYAGITTDVKFVGSNQGWFQVRETDNTTYFDVDGRGVEEFVTTSANSFVFTPYHSARPGDQLVVSIDAPVATANKGTFIITDVPTTASVRFLNTAVATESPTTLGAAGTSSISVLDQGFSCFRKVVMFAPKPEDPANRSLCIVSPGYNLSLLSEGQGARASLPNRLGYSVDPVPGINGYNIWTGLKRKVQRVVDGYEPDPSSFPGVGAAGVTIEVREPQIARITLGVKVVTSKGVSLQSISDTIKSAISGYVNSLGLGNNVIMSEVIRLVQEVPGVQSCTLSDPSPGSANALAGRIVIGDAAIARISSSDITLA
jgi:hypothetical protein